MNYKEYKQLNLTEIGEEIRRYWEENQTFETGQQLSEGHPSFVFYDGPPSANGKPGIHHVMARAIKDVFCRYKALKGFHVERKAGWDTHGLPVELGVEKNLGITKEDIGKKVSVDEYNKACREEVLKFKDQWDELTKEMGYWVDLKDPYITFNNEYIESLWHLLKMMYDKGLLYKGYTIQPYSPAAGTGLSSHELNMPGCYRDVKDTTCVALFRLAAGQQLPFGIELKSEEVQAVAWTTTPWTLPSNTALCVGPNFDYVLVRTVNPYTAQPITVIMAQALVKSFFKLAEGQCGAVGEKSTLAFADFQAGGKELPFEILASCKGKALEGLRYQQLIPWVKPTGDDAFRFILGDYVTVEDGTGIVHIAPTFGADDDRVAKKAGIGSLYMKDKDGKLQPMVDRSGKFFLTADLDEAWAKDNISDDYKNYEGKYVKNAYDETKGEKDLSLDVEIVVMLKESGKLFRSEKHAHSYPHCWRTDKPVLYYPLDSWFIRTTALKERMIELNKTINWKPEATGTGRFGNWLENIVDWNLSRSRYWGTPLPIWRTEDGKEECCIGSVEQLRSEIDKAVAAGFMENNPYAGDYTAFDLHRPYIDNVVLVSPTGRPMHRETDLIDVWFDSGAMPYAQMHFMGQPEDLKPEQFPADFIAEGVDQTRGWFYTLHAISTMCFDSVAFRNVISNGLVLDKAGNKMSKRLGNAIDPFEVINKYGPDATRWYMLSNSQPWDNLKFDVEGVDEVRRKLFGTLYNTYSFFALYANLDGFQYKEADVAQRPEIDRWILSELNTLVKTVDEALADYEPTRATRAIQEFVDANLSNWYVRLCRRRFWKGDYSEDKISAYQTLYTCLDTLARLMSPFAPFFSERLFLDLNAVTGREAFASVHHTAFPAVHEEMVDKDLEQRMQLAQQICSMVLSLRKKSNIRVRQPLEKIILPIHDADTQRRIEAVSALICSEVNVKRIEFLPADNTMLVKKIKPNFKTLGPRYGKIMKAIAAAVNDFSQEQISAVERDGCCELTIEGQPVEILLSDVEIATQDIPGWVVANSGSLTVALDIVITPELRNEGLARELVNRIQNIRKDAFEVTDRILIDLVQGEWDNAVMLHMDYICNETLTDKLSLVSSIADAGKQIIEIIDGVPVDILVRKA